MTSIGAGSGDGGNRTHARVPAAIDLTIPGKPRGKGRPRFDREHGRVYTDAKTEGAEALIRSVWMRAGRPRLDDGPLSLDIEIVLQRPQGHWRVNGMLSASGERAPWPTKKPDLDNAVKLVMDALNSLAYRDDVQVVSAQMVKRWANPGEPEHTRIIVRSVEGVALEAAA